MFKLKNKNKGFTLIELLVVIAIIGILSSVVLASLNTARNKGADAAVKANLSSIRPQAEIVYDSASPNSYDTVCADASVAKAIAAAQSASGGAATCYDAATQWAAYSPLKNPVSPSTGWCIDYTGTAKNSAALAANATVCP